MSGGDRSRVSGWSFLIGALVAAGCGGGGTSPQSCTPLSSAALTAWNGVYAVDDYTINSSGCDAEGPSMVGELGEPDFVVAGDVIQGTPIVMVAGCPDAATCQQNGANPPPTQYQFGAWVFCDGGDGAITAAYTFAGTPNDSGTCDKPSLLADTMTQPAPQQVRLEARTYVGDPYPQDSPGHCANTGSDTSTASACTQYTVLTGTLVEGI